MKLDWPAIWTEFDEWCNEKEVRCDKCGSFDSPDWDEQMKKIQSLVYKHIKMELRGAFKKS